MPSFTIYRHVCDARLGGEGVGSGCQGDWKKIQAVARVISHTPFQATSLSHYYSIIAPQVRILYTS